MGAREVIAGALRQWGLGESSARMAQHAVEQLERAGYVILSPDEVRGIRDEALEDAACLIEQHGITYGDTNALSPRIDGDRNGLDYASAIRSLKGGRDAQ